MGCNQHTPNLPTNHHLTRRSALMGTAAVGALALPAGAVVAHGDHDPGLAQLEAGYRRWQEMRQRLHDLDDRAAALDAKARAELAPVMPPKPKRSRRIAKWIKEDGGYTYGLDRVPEHLRDAVEAHSGAMIRWRHACNKMIDQHPDGQAADEAGAATEALQDEAYDYRRELLAIPTSSPRDLFVKLALAVEAEELDGVEAAIAEIGPELGWPGEAFVPALAADLRAMAVQS